MLNIRRIITDLGLVRVVSLDLDPRQGSDILVQQRDSLDLDWQTIGSFNSFTTDSAYTNARELAFEQVRFMSQARAQGRF